MTNRCSFFNILSISLMAIVSITVSAEDKMMTPAKEMLISHEEHLATLLPENEILWLTTDDGKFLALKRDYLATKERGIAILVSDIATPVNHKVDINPIRKELNEYGWTTISINPPSGSLLNPVVETPPSMAKNDKDMKPTDSKDDTDVAMAEKPAMNKSMVDPESTMKENDGLAYTDELIERVLSAQEWAIVQSRNTILIIQGRQVAYLTNALIQQHLHDMRAIVVIDANTAVANSSSALYPTTSNQLSTALSQLKMPLLDIYHLKNAKVRADMLKRKQMSIKEGQRGYRQYLKSTYSKEKHLSKIIYGWLKTLGIK